MLKVAQIIRRFSFNEWGGTENVVWNSSLELSKLGIEVEILASSALDCLGEELRDSIRIRKFPYFYPYFPLSEKNRLALDKKGGNPYSFELEKALIEGGFDLLHVHSGGRMAQMALSIAKKCKIPVIFSIHGGFADIPAMELKNMLAPTKYSFRYGAIMDRVLGRNCDIAKEMDGLICVGLNEYDILRDKYPQQNISYIANGVDVNYFSTTEISSKDFRNKYSISHQVKLILCVSRIDYQKNQIQALELLLADENAHLLLIGPISSQWYYEKLQAKASELNLSKRISFIEGLSPKDPDLVAAFHAADIFILPSSHEPFGIVVLEAWASNCPVLSSKAGGLGRLVENNRTALTFDAGNSAQLLEQYNRLNNDANLRARLIKNGYDEVQNYSWNHVAEQLVELYQGLIRRQ